MNILVLGGTGAIGVPLVDMLSAKHSLVVTTRSSKDDKYNVHYEIGNAKKDDFFCLC